MEYLFIIGLIIAGLGYLWMIVTGFREHWGWGIAITLFVPSALLFAMNHYRKGIAPFNVMIAGLLIAFTPALLTRLVPVDLGPHESVVNGELHLTLTGWDQDDYSVIARKPETNILQMANEDVTDDSLKYISHMKQLRELDISHSQVTDEGLEVLKDLPELQTLWLQDVAITDTGFKNWIMSHPGLQRINLVGTEVSPELVQQWMSADPQRIAMQ